MRPGLMPEELSAHPRARLGDIANLGQVRCPAIWGQVVPETLACCAAADLAVNESVPALGVLEDLLEQVASGGDRLGDAEQVRVSAKVGRPGVAADLLFEEVLDVVLPAQGELVEPLHLGVGQDVLCGIAAAVVLAVHHVRCARAGRHDHQDVALAGLARGANGLGAHVQWLVDQGVGDLVQSLWKPLKVDRGELRRLGLVVVVDPDDQHAAVDRELGHVASVLLVGALAKVQLALEVDRVPLKQQPVVEHLLKEVFGTGQPSEHDVYLHG